jgi:hypothetical protein
MPGQVAFRMSGSASCGVLSDPYEGGSVREKIQASMSGLAGEIEKPHFNEDESQKECKVPTRI